MICICRAWRTMAKSFHPDSLAKFPFDVEPSQIYHLSQIGSTTQTSAPGSCSMYSLVLLTAMSAAPETTSFGDIWAKKCFWEACHPARYGWVACGPGFQPYYPASYHSCHG